MPPFLQPERKKKKKLSQVFYIAQSHSVHKEEFGHNLIHKYQISTYCVLENKK